MDLFTQPPAASASGLGTQSESSAGEFRGNSPGKTRSACIRCHAQKLKCVRREGEASSCERCFRLKTSCRFGPRAARSPSKWLDKGATEIPQESLFAVPASMSVQVQHIDTLIAGVNELEQLSLPGSRTQAGCVMQPNSYYNISNPFDKEDMYWNPFLGAENRSENIENYANMDIPPVCDDFANQDFYAPATLETGTRIDDQNTLNIVNPTPPSIVHKLASLNVALYECGLKFPIPIKEGSDSVKISTRKSRIFAIDELFRLTGEFLDILTSVSCEVERPNFSPSTTQTEENAELTNFLSEDTQHLSRTMYSDYMEGTTTSFQPLDEATMFMIMSCHCRLIDMYATLLQMMQACTRHSLAPRMDKNWAVLLPKLQVGSMALPPVRVDISNPVPQATSSMYMLMVTTLSAQVWEQLADKMKVNEKGFSVRTDSSSKVTETIWDNIVNKNDRMLQIINDTRQLLQ